MTIEQGFPGQRLYVLPRPRVTDALSQSGTSHLLVTDCGYFPQARAHGIFRKFGISQAIVMVCVRGKGWCRIGGVSHSVHAGQVLIVPPGVSHSYGAEQDDPWTLWWLHLAGQDLPELLGTAQMTPQQPVRTLSDSFRVVALIEEIVTSIGRDSSNASLLAASGAAWHLMALLSADPNARGSRMDIIDQAKEYLRNHLDTRISVEELAVIASLSVSHFAALFRQHVGMPVLQYQTQLRMARARELLDTSDLTVRAIAEHVGYTDAFYFSRQFKATHRVTPSQYRRQAKG
jgi:AraC family transcriptional regulator of arabinose operon